MIIHEEVVELSTPTGPMRTYLYQPTEGADTSGHWPGILLYSEIFQQTGPIKRSALQFASQGYLVAVPEIYHESLPPGAVLGYDQAGSDVGNRWKYETPLSTFDNDAAVVLSYLKSHPAGSGKAGVVGFCIGGHLAFRAALHSDALATCCFYATDIHTDTLGAGKSSDSLRRMGEIKGEIMMAWGRQDPHVPEEGRALIYDTIRKAGVNFTWHEFNAVHAFMRDEGPRYNPALARLCYGLAFETLDRVLKR